MRVGLYQKFFTWAMLNLVLLGVITALFIGGVLLFNNNLYSPMLFNGSIASTFRMTSVELQYKPENQWASVLEECGRECGLHFGILILDDMDPPLAAGGLPPRVVEAARTIPRPPYSLCAEPDSGAFSTITPAVELEAGILPQQYVIFMRDGDPAQYWYARTILVSNDEGVVRYVLLAASSPSITGNGHFFELRLAVALLLSGLGLSFLWWWPFVRHLTKPIILMTKVTERIAAGDYSSLSDDSPISLKAVGEGRGDQIGCLAKATGIMAEKVKQQVHGQRRFIRHIAHELDSPLARIKLGLAVLDSRVDEKNQQRVQEISDEVEQLSLLVEDVLSFMRSEAIPESPAREAVSLAPLLQYVTRREAPGPRRAPERRRGAQGLGGRKLPRTGARQRGAQRRALCRGRRPHRHCRKAAGGPCVRGNPRQRPRRPRRGNGAHHRTVLPGRTSKEISRRLRARHVHRQALRGSLRGRAALLQSIPQGIHRLHYAQGL